MSKFWLNFLLSILNVQDNITIFILPISFSGRNIKYFFQGNTLAMESYHLSLFYVFYAACKSGKGQISLKTELKDFSSFSRSKSNENS